MSNLWTVTYAFKICNLAKLRADILLRFQWQIKRASLGLGLALGFTSTSPLRNTSRLKKRQVELIKWWRKIISKKGTTWCFLVYYPGEKIRHWRKRISYWQKLRGMLYSVTSVVRIDEIVYFGTIHNIPTVEKSYCPTILRKINQHL